MVFLFCSRVRVLFLGFIICVQFEVGTLPLCVGNDVDGNEIAHGSIETPAETFINVLSDMCRVNVYSEILQDPTYW